MSIKRIEYQLNSVILNNMDLIRNVASRITHINELQAENDLLRTLLNKASTSEVSPIHKSANRRKDISRKQKKLL